MKGVNYFGVISDTAVIERFASVVEPAFERIANNTKENQNLSQLRDWLLPMLMNGQVTINFEEATEPRCEPVV